MANKEVCRPGEGGTVDWGQERREVALRYPHVRGRLTGRSAPPMANKEVCRHGRGQRTTSKANPFRYSVSGIIGITGWSGDCAYVATRRRIFRVSKAADSSESRNKSAPT